MHRWQLPITVPPVAATRKHTSMASSYCSVDFREGLVLGLSFGPSWIGYAVRRGMDFLDLGVVAISGKVPNLEIRRLLRHQRRTLRSRRYRMRWFREELEKLTLTCPQPGSNLHDPIGLRLRAVRGEDVTPTELYVALVHLFRRRGYSEVPWRRKNHKTATAVHEQAEDDSHDRMQRLNRELANTGCSFPCQLLEQRRRSGQAQRNIIWPRHLIELEFRQIVRMQRHRFPLLADKQDWLLYGDTPEVNGHRVYSSTKDTRNPGVLGVRWPKFDNRHPGLDILTPFDEQGQARHVIRRDSIIFRKSLLHVALMNLKVLERGTNAVVTPDPESMARLGAIWASSRRGTAQSRDAKRKVASVVVTKRMLNAWVTLYKHRYRLLNDQRPLTAQSGPGRAKISAPTLKLIRTNSPMDLAKLSQMPILQRRGETRFHAVNRIIKNIIDPAVRHRLLLVSREIERLVAKHGKPRFVVVEIARTFGLGRRAAEEFLKRAAFNQKQRYLALHELKASQQSSSSRATTRYLLWKEAGGTCPFCLQSIEQSDLGTAADIEFIVPRVRIDCNDYYNLTVAHLRCSVELKQRRTPFEAFGHTPMWEHIQANAAQHFKGRKLRLLTSNCAEEVLERELERRHYTYVTKLIRRLIAVQLGWLNDEGREPSGQADNRSLYRCYDTCTQVTSRLRQAWGLNSLLHALPDGRRWNNLTGEEVAAHIQKSQADVRCHAINAMVIACTVPWLANRTRTSKDHDGNHGWWTEDDTRRSVVVNPVGLSEGLARQSIASIRIRHHVSRSPHRKSYGTTLYAKKADNTYVARSDVMTLSGKDLGSIWPRELAEYFQVAWTLYQQQMCDSGDRRSRSSAIPEDFVSRLCFRHFQQWREHRRRGSASAFCWPHEVKIPLRRVKVISVNDDNAVTPVCKGGVAFVKRTCFREVRICPAIDGSFLVPVFVPYWRNDGPVASKPHQGRVVRIIRRGMVVNLQRAVGGRWPPGQYRVTSTMQKCIQLAPAHIVNEEDSLKAFGYLGTGVTISWRSFFKAIGLRPPSEAL